LIHQAGGSAAGTTWFVGLQREFWRHISRPKDVAVLFANKICSGSEDFLDFWALSIGLTECSENQHYLDDTIPIVSQLLEEKKSHISDSLFVTNSTEYISHRPVWVDELEPLTLLSEPIKRQVDRLEERCLLSESPNATEE